jgi:hypothetical protein
MRRLLGPKPSPLDPGRFHFDEHTPPAPRGGLREHFSRVELGFENGEFTRPQWQHYRMIPRAIQTIAVELTEDAGPPQLDGRLPLPSANRFDRHPGPR